jgi:tetratricopeptide (TPR) repeat protein
MLAMSLVGQPDPSPELEKAFTLLAQGQEDEAETVVKKAALRAKGHYGSGSHPLALAYADLARFHYRVGQFERSAQEFQHAAKGPLPEEKGQREDRLTFMLGFAAALLELDKLDEADKVFRQCLAFARNIHGAQSAFAAVCLVPLADTLLKAGKTAEAAKLAFEAYNSLWKLGDSQVVLAVGTRAEALKATGRADDPFADLNDLPDELVSAAVTNTLARSGKGDGRRVRAVLADLLKFVEKKYGDGNSVTCDTLAAVAHHEAALGSNGDERVRRLAVRRSVWSFVARRIPAGLMSNLEVGFEPGGTIHLAPHLARTPKQSETVQLETALNQAVDDLYARPML